MPGGGATVSRRCRTPTSTGAAKAIGLVLPALKGQWLLVSVSGGACDASCEGHLYLQRQLRESLGREKDRVDWVWLVDDGSRNRDALLAVYERWADKGWDVRLLDGGDAPAPDLLAAVINVGRRPTFESSTGILSEAHLLDFEGALYVRRVEFGFAFHLRDERRFPSVDALRRQIGLDAEEARIEKARQDCEDRIEETGADMERERQLAADATETLRRITEDEAAVTAAMDGGTEAIAAAAGAGAG